MLRNSHLCKTNFEFRIHGNSIPAILYMEIIEPEWLYRLDESESEIAEYLPFWDPI